MKTDADFIVGDDDVGGHVDQIAKDLARSGIIVATHAARYQAIQGGSQDQQRRVEIYFESDRGRQRVDVKKAHGVGQGILDQHVLGIVGNQLLGR
jgi:hypothetical protein